MSCRNGRRYELSLECTLLILLIVCSLVHSMLLQHHLVSRLENFRKKTIVARLYSTSDGRSNDDSAFEKKLSLRRNELLSRRGPYWKLDRSQWKVEFGTTVELTTNLVDGGEGSWEDIADWLSDPQAVALSIWDPIIPLEEEKSGKNKDVYRLEVMRLSFVTLTVQPTVDVIMKTEFHENDPKKPIFIVQSIGYNPNVSLLPGVTVESLNISIEVAGRLVPTKNGKGVVGAIAFTSSGFLSLPLRLVPEDILRSACETINDTVARFALNSFKKGAQEKYKQFMMNRRTTANNAEELTL